MKHIESIQELETILKKEKFVLLDFYAEWCEPCKKISELLPELHSLFPKLYIVKVNVDDADEDFVAEYKVKAIPHLVYFHRGEMMFTGSSYSKLQSTLEELLN